MNGACKITKLHVTMILIVYGVVIGAGEQNGKNSGW